MKHLFFTLAAVMLLCTSCATYVSLEPDANAYWKGKPHSEIVQAYGAPDRETEDGLGGKILIYENERTVVNTTSFGPDPMFVGGVYGFYYHVMDTGRSYSTSTTTETDYAHFYIGKDNICYAVKTNLEKEIHAKR